jgi:membrane fusion protein (multidrug efflux system)
MISTGSVIPVQYMHMMIKIIRASAISFAFLACAVTAQAQVYEGRIEALQRLDISSQLDAVVELIHFEPGQRVAKGDLLFTLDSTDSKLQVQLAEANVQRTTALIDLARQDLERAEKLKARGVGSDVQLLKAKGAKALAEAVQAEASAKLTRAQTELVRTQIYAPIPGVIGSPHVHPGGFAEVGQDNALAQIVQLDPIRLIYEIPYAERITALRLEDLTNIEESLQTIRLRIEISPERMYSDLAKPSFMSSDVDPGTGRVMIWAQVKNPGHVLRPGLQVRAHVVVP